MGSISTNRELAKEITAHDATKWDAIFLSGGGNDLIDALPQIICTPSPGAGNSFLDYISRIEVARLKNVIEKGYLAIAAMRDGSVNNKTTPIITHIYDYPTPRNAPAKFVGIGFKGPWLYPALKAQNVDEKYWISISDYLFESLGEILIGLSAKMSNFHVVHNTKETLVRAELNTTGVSGDWLNEIHATGHGYQKMADVISPELNLLINPA
jgi:hypothetical protein